MTTLVTCPKCEAVYRRREVKAMNRDRDTFECCGVVLESWNSSRFPMFELVTPGTKPYIPEA
ncbi:hypothetical protein [Phenylobacterium immobile]|uniref:hypothetical protein n=1 Tax=Phenylobacterium immobile TaxID=21 RepID=UPI000ABF96E0|nr:hypothetical protein [Phenylobacterium immobile]